MDGDGGVFGGVVQLFEGREVDMNDSSGNKGLRSVLIFIGLVILALFSLPVFFGNKNKIPSVNSGNTTQAASPSYNLGIGEHCYQSSQCSGTLVCLQNTCQTFSPDPSPPTAIQQSPKVDSETTCDSVQECQQGLIDRGYDVGSKGADGIYGVYTQRAWHQCYIDHRCKQDAPGDEYIVPPAVDYINTGIDVPGDGYGEISPRTGLPRTHYVHDYTRSNGTHVNGYYRSHK